MTNISWLPKVKGLHLDIPAWIWNFGIQIEAKLATLFLIPYIHTANNPYSPLCSYYGWNELNCVLCIYQRAEVFIIPNTTTEYMTTPLYSPFACRKHKYHIMAPIYFWWIEDFFRNYDIKHMLRSPYCSTINGQAERYENLSLLHHNKLKHVFCI